MDRPVLMRLLAGAEQRLVLTEAHIRQHLGAINGAEGDQDLSEAKRVLETLQQQRIECGLEVQRLQDEIACCREDGV
jgi:hypothetical protein